MKRVVFVSQSTGYLMIDILNAYLSKYDEVVLIAGSIEVMERNLDQKVSVKKIISYNRNSAFRRIYTWVMSTIQIYIQLLFRFRGFEIVFVTNPPFAYLTSILLSNKFSIIIYDIYPEALKNIGIKEGNLFYQLWQKLNKKVFLKADNIYTLSDNMAITLSKYVDNEKIKVIQNWSGSENFKPIDKKENSFIIKEGIENKFIVLYSGNIGYTHNVEAIIEVANFLKKEDDILFLFIGEGHKKKELMQYAKNNSLKNCKFLTWQTSEILPFSLASADLGVVTLNDKTSNLSVPSKTYNLLAAGVALLSIASDDSELARLIKKYNNGKNFSSNQPKDIADFILDCKNNNDELKKMSNNSIIASKDFTYQNANLYL